MSNTTQQNETNTQAQGNQNMKTTHYKTSKDKNGNKVVRITPDTGRGFSIQTLGNLPQTHRDGVGSWTAGEVESHVLAYGTAHQKNIIS